MSCEKLGLAESYGHVLSINYALSYFQWFHAINLYIVLALSGGAVQYGERTTVLDYQRDRLRRRVYHRQRGKVRDPIHDQIRTAMLIRQRTGI